MVFQRNILKTKRRRKRKKNIQLLKLKKTDKIQLFAWGRGEKPNGTIKTMEQQENNIKMFKANGQAKKKKKIK